MCLFMSTFTDKTGEVNSGDHYQNISVVQEPAKPSLNLLHYVHSKIEPGAVSASCILNCVGRNYICTVVLDL